MSEGVRECKKHNYVHMAVPYWFRRITKANPRVDNDWDMIGIDQAALNGCKETQVHTDCQLGNP